MWTIAPFMNRICSKDFILKYDNKFLNIKKDTMIWFPVAGLHKDPKYFPNPEKFDPERFSEENKANINMNAYLPFGIGPRNCIGSRFALMEVKTMLYYMLLNFTLEATEKTRIPLVLEKLQFADKIKDGVRVKLKPRE